MMLNCIFPPLEKQRPQNSISLLFNYRAAVLQFLDALPGLIIDADSLFPIQPQGYADRKEWFVVGLADGRSMYKFKINRAGAPSFRTAYLVVVSDDEAVRHNSSCHPPHNHPFRQKGDLRSGHPSVEGRVRNGKALRQCRWGLCGVGWFFACIFKFRFLKTRGLMSRQTSWIALEI